MYVHHENAQNWVKFHTKDLTLKHILRRILKNIHLRMTKIFSDFCRRRRVIYLYTQIILLCLPACLSKIKQGKIKFNEVLKY